ncbi:MHYT domain-containing protein, NO-binding membrane sensor [Sinosporangium album]|uniref:MHYT domain-containing protein, NO-binding membrane sensor n=1 Tax=Sinosporangium album TaxID=504805 RepID=A0A1G7XK99_9ACTN|nr:MHYT domain-containing protein [Sinosporangium album]SDG84493.1 MHYT domain-containing protein, NO-binding membrane sensor [Sinosporangium album]
MASIDHFSYGLLTPLLAYVMSASGSMLGLLLTARARSAEGPSKYRWLAGAAISIGGTGIWVMHFIAMMGFDVRGTQIRYDVPLTVISALIAIVVVSAGLVVVSKGGDRVFPLLAGGLLTGLGVASMHYLGMAAMNMSGHVSYDPLVVGVSLLIAVVAATVALWFTLKVSGAIATTAAALIMGVAVCGMHYTGMFAMSVEVHPATAPVPGAEGIDFLLPLLVGISLVTLGLLLAVLLSPSEGELRSEAELIARLQNTRGDRLGQHARPAAPGKPAQESEQAGSLFNARRNR